MYSTDEHEGSDDDSDLPTNPLVIKFDSLRTSSLTRKDEEGKSGSNIQELAPIVIHRPSILRVILLQSQATNNPTEKSNMDLISLSGVVLHYSNRVWKLHEGFNFHDPLSIEEDVGSNLETHIIPGGIEAKFSHALNCWYVFPPPPGIDSPSHHSGASSPDSK